MLDTGVRVKLQWQYAWEHFKFHAEQRTRMFNFFLIIIGVMLSAYGVFLGSENIGTTLTRWSFLIPAFSAIVSTIFLALDVRNTQLLEYSEVILRILEKDELYPQPGWWEEIKEKRKIKAGILSREELLKRHIDSSAADVGMIWWLKKKIYYDNIKHKTGLRAIYLATIILFWSLALQDAAEKANIDWIPYSPRMVFIVLLFLAGVSFFWCINALATPKRHLENEVAAYKNNKTANYLAMGDKPAGSPTAGKS
jgi:hypothetical protein